MTLNLTMPKNEELKPRITVFGVGGAGGNAVNNMIEKALDGVEFVVANTDAQALQQSKSASRVQLGVKATEGLGAGARPSVGAASAEENIEEIIDHLAGSHMCFITAGMGGGTGTGATPIIAQAARELGVLTVGVVTKPFQFEGAKRMRQAEEGVENLQKVVDTLIIIPNQNLFRLANEKTTFTEAFAMADDVLYQGVKGVTDLMVRPGLVNLDFADVRAVMDEMGKAMMGTGESEGEERAIQAAEKAIANPLLDEISLKGAKGVLINITGGEDLSLFEVDEAANRIREEVDPEANIIVGSTLDPEMNGRMRVSVVATGIDVSESAEDIPRPRRTMAEPLAAEVEETPAVEETQEQPLELTKDKQVDSQPMLFDRFENDPAMQEIEQSLEADTASQDDDLPGPVYTAPEEESFDAHSHRFAEDVSEEKPAEPVQVSQHRERGAPSPATLARLHAAVVKEPPAQQPRLEYDHQEASEQASHQAPQQSSVDRPRFGINSLINRMTGSHDTGSHEDDHRTRATPRVTRTESETKHRVYDDRQDHAGDEHIEIPAFLRRQAN